MTDSEAIRARHSVRNYKPERIGEEIAGKLRDKIEELNRESGLHLQYIEDAGKTYNKLLNRTAGLDSAPSVIACVGREDIKDLDEKVGYYGEKLVLYAQDLGLNTCWAGIFSRKKIPVAVDPGEKLVISIAIGYGENQGQEHRSKPVDQISQSAKERPEWFEKGVEMALLAPTAMNQQKFLIKLNEDESVEFIDKGGFFSKVDLGIVKCHFEIGSGRKIEWT
ncbi:MAG: nitroreductase [Lachnospiraceae bacterium]|nr:nitroreductase [Lachnospiraceae bacterium]